jgi:hypothetical protein
LKNEVLGGYGGILIRGIFDLNSKKAYKGPMVCAMKLFSGTSAFQQSIQTKIIENKLDRRKVVEGPRKGLGKNAIESGTDKLNYSFEIDLKD